MRKAQHPEARNSTEYRADNRHIALKALYRLRSESSRLQVADVKLALSFSEQSTHQPTSVANDSTRWRFCTSWAGIARVLLLVSSGRRARHLHYGLLLLI
jgi:hypothetical protein